MADRPTCFVAMPAGRGDAARVYDNWYKIVLVPAIRAAEHEPFLCKLDTAPVMLNDTIRDHLVHDPMAFFDLAGLNADDAPNPNVMYELGLRHAFDKPCVTYAWSAELLPFDVKEQRSILWPRRLESMEEVQRDVTAAIKRGAAGDFYRPMRAVARAEMLAQVVPDDSPMALLVEQMSEMQQSLGGISGQVRHLAHLVQRREAENAGVRAGLDLWKNMTPNLDPVREKILSMMGEQQGPTPMPSPS
jgi:hypothetical protein